MTIRYVGPGGADGNSGLTWALRKLTLNGVEDTPVVAGDTVYVGPGVYREQLTVDVSGGGVATPITYIADVTGENTDDIGGIVRITGSDNDQTQIRGNCITADAKDYRTFRGFKMDMGTGQVVNTTNGCNSWILEDCSLVTSATAGLYISGQADDWIVRRCFFMQKAYQYSVDITNGATYDDAGHLFENCIWLGYGRSIITRRVGGIIVKNCTFIGSAYAVRVFTAVAAGQTVDVYNCVFAFCMFALQGTVLGEVIEDYNTFYGNGTDRNAVAVGANSITYPPLYLLYLLFDGIKMPQSVLGLSEWSQISRLMDAFDDDQWGIHRGVSVTEDDLYGIYRPTGVSLLSWGAVQLREGERETGTKRTGAAAINLDSAGDHQLFVPVTNISTTIEVYVYREANYEGLAPQMIIRQPGQDDEVVTDTGASGAWNQLTKTLTPAADPPYVCVILRSHNTALAGNFDVFFDDLDVS